MWLSHRSIVVVSAVMVTFPWRVGAMPGGCSAGGSTGAGGVVGFGALVGSGGVTDRTAPIGTNCFCDPGAGGSTGAGGVVGFGAFAGSGGVTDKIIGKKRAQARCVPFHQCCDKLKNSDKTNNSDNTTEPTFLGLIDERTGNPLINIRSNNKKKCGGLNLCCTCVEDPGSQETKEELTHQAQAVCGKRNEHGVGITVTGFKDGQTQQGEFPWMVAVLKNDITFVGGGSLLQPKMVLTAAHKVHKETPGNLIARIGDWDISKQIESIAPQNINVGKIYLHNKFNEYELEYNVAILILKTEAKYGETVAPVCLPEPGQNFDGKDCFVTGWGKDNAEGEYQTIMKKVSIPIVAHSECERLLQDGFRKTHGDNLASNFRLHISNTCAGGGKEDTCEGDGGGPLVCPGLTNQQELVQVGVVSWGAKCGVEGNPGVYASIPKSLDWITKTMADEDFLSNFPRD